MKLNPDYKESKTKKPDLVDMYVDDEISLAEFFEKMSIKNTKNTRQNG